METSAHVTPGKPQPLPVDMADCGEDRMHPVEHPLQPAEESSVMEIESIDAIYLEPNSLATGGEVTVVANIEEAAASTSQPPSNLEEPTLSDGSIAIVPTPLKPGDYVQWESNGILKMPVAMRLSRFSDDGNFAFIEGSNTGIPAEELIAVDLIAQSAGESESALGASAAEAGINPAFEETDAAPDSDELPLDNSVLSAIDQAQRIDRNPGDSVTEYIRDKEFSQTWLDLLYARWDDGVEAFFVGWEGRCELVYEIHKETVKPGCKVRRLER